MVIPTVNHSLNLKGVIWTADTDKPENLSVNLQSLRLNYQAFAIGGVSLSR
jgi:hypothetical protein